MSISLMQDSCQFRSQTDYLLRDYSCFLLTNWLFLIELLDSQIKPKWRNRQTRYVQGVVSIMLMRVQIPPSAFPSNPLIKARIAVIY